MSREEIFLYIAKLRAEGYIEVFRRGHKAVTIVLRKVKGNIMIKYTSNGWVEIS